MEFDDVQRRVLDLYGKQRYEAGIELISRARSEHPDQDSRLTFWEACLLGRSGRPGEALEVLSSGLDRGLWWDPRVLADSDLDNVRGLSGWGEMVTRSARAVAKDDTPPPAPQIRPATRGKHAGTLIALHGAGADPVEHARRWDAAAPRSWTVITPAGNVPMSDGRWAWPFDLSLEPLLAQLENLDLRPPLVLAGWSQGGGLAAAMAWSGRHDVEGILLIGPGLREEWDPGVDQGVPTYVVVGEEDPSLTSCLELRDRMTQHGVPVFLDERSGLGHEPPENLEEVIEDAIGWILDN